MRQVSSLRFVVSFVVALLLALPLLYPHLLRCMLVSRSGDFRTLTDGSATQPLYVSTSATARQRTLFQQHVRNARQRIRQFWGGPSQGRAILIYCPRQTDYARYCAGGEGAGCSLGTPWGDAYLVLGPDGNSVDVIAHELCHDELFARLGWWRVKRQIPQWYNEGLALLVDYRFSSPDLWEQPDRAAGTEPLERRRGFSPMLPLADLETTSDFFGGDYDRVMLAYQTAADEVARWVQQVGRAGVPALARAVAGGEPFANAYRRLERERRQRPGR